MQGYFITFEGGDGAGKSTQINRLKNYLESMGYEVVLTREPGGTDIGEKIRDIILDTENKDMSPMTEAMLYAASRAQHVAEIIKPAIESGKIVICDRFIDSSIAYQGYGRNLGDKIIKINDYVIDDCMPHLTILLKLDPKKGKKRMSGRNKDRIELENLEFHQRVYDGYETLQSLYPERIVGIDASGSIEDIEAEIRRHVLCILFKAKKMKA